MKKIYVFAAAALALVGCSKEVAENSETNVDGGQLVTITCSAPGTKVTSAGNAEGVTFKWESTDKLLVEGPSSQSTFDYVSGAGEATATFTGYLPEGTSIGDDFDITVLYGGTPDYQNQTYCAGGLPHNMMSLKASKCKLDQNITIQPEWSALCLKFYIAYERSVSKIVVTRKDGDTVEDTFTLTCDGGATVSTASANPTPFYIVVPTTANEKAYTFDVKVYDTNTEKYEIGSFSSTTGVTFASGEVESMPAKQLTTIFTVTNASELTSTISTNFAADSSPSGPYEVILKEGTYTCGDMTILETKCKHLTFRGEGEVTLKYSGSNNRVFYLLGHNNDSDSESVTFKNLKFDLGSAVAVQLSNDTNKGNVHDINLVDCEFTGTNTSATAVNAAQSGTNPSRITFTNCKTTGTDTQFGYFYNGYAKSGADFIVKADNCTFSGKAFINYQSDGPCVVSNCKVTFSNDYGVRMRGDKITVTSSEFHSTYNGADKGGCIVYKKAGTIDIDGATTFEKIGANMHDLYSDGGNTIQITGRTTESFSDYKDF